jgi:hypothetical protein
MAEDRATLYEPETLLPSQYFGGQERDDGIAAERSLMQALLADAIDCYQRYALARDARGMALFDDAHRWVHSHDREWLLSFDNTCEALGLDADRIREGLSRWAGARPRRRRARPRIVSVAGRVREQRAAESPRRAA